MTIVELFKSYGGHTNRSDVLLWQLESHHVVVNTRIQLNCVRNVNFLRKQQLAGLRDKTRFTQYEA